MDSFLYDMDLRLESVNGQILFRLGLVLKLLFILSFQYP